jgi:hypothetical protein
MIIISKSICFSYSTEEISHLSSSGSWYKEPDWTHNGGVHKTDAMDKTIDFSDDIHRPVLDLKQRFEYWILPPFSGKKHTQLDPIDRASPCY